MPVRFFPMLGVFLSVPVIALGILAMFWVFFFASPFVVLLSAPWVVPVSLFKISKIKRQQFNDFSQKARQTIFDYLRKMTGSIKACSCFFKDNKDKNLKWVTYLQDEKQSWNLISQGQDYEEIFLGMQSELSQCVSEAGCQKKVLCAFYENCPFNSESVSRKNQNLIWVEQNVS